MTRQNLLTQAKEGDETAIATLLDTALEHKKIHVNINLSNGCLQVELISETRPDWKYATILIDRELQRINSDLIQKVHISDIPSNPGSSFYSEEFIPGDYAEKIFINRSQSQVCEPENLGYYSRTSIFSELFQNITPQPIYIEGYQSLAAGILLSILMLNSQQVIFIFSYLNIRRCIFAVASPCFASSKILASVAFSMNFYYA